jgi:lipid-A-disaccharide synthase-like uncharacterized protein
MRKYFFWFGWIVLLVLPVAFAVEIIAIQNLPEIQLWKWGILAGAVLLVYFSRSRDEVFKHHVV